MKTELEKLPLFDLMENMLCIMMTNNAKMLRRVIISDKRGCMFGKNIISKSQLEYLFNASEIHNYKGILNPNNLQNVPAVLRLVDMLKTCADNIKYSSDQVCEELIYRYKNNPFVQLYVLDLYY